MKQLTLVSLFIIIASFAKAQLNKTQSEIMQLMANDNKWTFEGSGHNNAGEPYLSYRYKEKDWTKGFYFKNDSCGMINLIIPNNQLGDIIKDMNSKFTSNGNNLWTDDKEKTHYAIILTDNKPYFQVYEVLISSVQKILNSN